MLVAAEKIDAMVLRIGLDAVIAGALDPETMRTVRLIGSLRDQSLYSQVRCRDTIARTHGGLTE